MVISDYSKHLFRFIVGMWFLNVAYTPAEARLMPYTLDEMGLLSPDYYFMAERESRSITVYTLEGKKVSTIENPKGHLCCPCMHPDVADMVYYASSTGVSHDLSWQVRERDLKTGEDRIILPILIKAFPFQLEAVGSRVGFLVLGEFSEGVRLFSPNSSQPRVLSPYGSKGLRVDQHKKKAWWIWSPSLAHSWDLPHPPIDTVTLHSLSMVDGEQQSFEIPAGTISQPVDWITPLAGKENTVVFVAFSKKEPAGGILYTYDTRMRVLTKRKIISQERIQFVEFPWAILYSCENEGCCRVNTFHNLVSGEEVERLDGEVYGLMIGKDGNPIVLTDTGVYVLPTGSKTLKKMYEVKLP